MKARHHAIERTSPKGPNEVFVGTCVLCGKTGLKIADSMDYCENTLQLTEDEALLSVLPKPGGE